MATPKSTWLALAIAVYSLCAAAIFYVVISAIYRGRHPESLHSLYTACAMATLFGAPILALISTGAVAGALRRHEAIPANAIRTRNIALFLVGAVILFVISLISVAFLQL